MTQFEPTIILNRLLITKGANSAYDQKFNKGVNIIRSKGNSTGKSTILDSIFFVLGGDIREWTDEALECDCIYAEVTFSGKIVTLKREISSSKFPPIYIFEGGMEAAKKQGLKWLKFSHKRSKDRESFSQAFFRLLGYPENKLSSFANITIHELLRLVYSDQMTAVNEIFKHQTFDSDEMRQTIGEFLLGIDDLDLHGLRLQLREEEKKLANLSGRLKATIGIFASAGLEPDNFKIQSQIDALSEKRQILRDRVSLLETPSEQKRSAKELTEMALVHAELAKVKLTIEETLNKKEAITYEIEDSKEFLKSIKERLSALDQSECAGEILGDIRFEFCPSCLSNIEIPAGNENTCHLCKKIHENEDDNSGYLRMQFELNYQINESTELLSARENEVKILNKSIEQLFFKRRSLQERYNSFVTTSDPITAELKDALTRIGQYDKMIDSLIEKQTLISIINELSIQKSNIGKSISSLVDEVDKKKQNRDRRLQIVLKNISDTTISILQNDIPSEETFAKSSEFEFDFGKNRLLVDGRSKFSASSVCYLKSAFQFALFLNSLNDKKMLFPRFLLLDNIEDKGATPERVQNMHNLIIGSLKNRAEAHQIIFTTSVLSPGLNDTDYCIGPEYNFVQKTLSL